MSEWIDMLKSDVNYADGVARKRQDWAERQEYGPTRGSTLDRSKQLLNNSVGARCEKASWLYLRLYTDICRLIWNEFIEGNPNGLADIDDFIEVKGRRKAWQELPVQPDPKTLKDPRKGDRPDRAFLLVRAHMHPRYEIVGWCWGHEAHTRPLIDPRGGTDLAHFINPGDSIFKPPALLGEELRRRHRWLESASASYQWF